MTNQDAVSKLDNLREALERAKAKMLREQERDPNSVWAEFEALIWAVEDSLALKFTTTPAATPTPPYPGEAYFREHNPAIRKAEDDWISEKAAQEDSANVAAGRPSEEQVGPEPDALAKGLVRAAIELAVLRGNLCYEDRPPIVVEECAEIVEDTWNAMQGIDTCSEEPCDELIAFRASVAPTKEQVGPEPQELGAVEPPLNKEKGGSGIPEAEAPSLAKFRIHEDSVEIACCLFNKQLLSDDTPDAAVEEIEAFMTALVTAAAPSEPQPQEPE